jgi:hypothetical protein
MRRTLLIAILVVMAVSGLAQTAPNIAALYDRLIQPSDTNAAAPDILEMAKKDSTARDFLGGKLPSLIVDELPRDARPVGPVWANAVRLAGQLKIAEAVPALKEALTHVPVKGGYDAKGSLVSMTFGTEARLDLDIVGRALADIGDASVPVLADILSSGDLPARRRAIWILWNINSPAAQKAMRDHLPSESDSILRGLIERLLSHVPQ